MYTFLPGPLPVTLVALGVAFDKRLLIYAGVGLYVAGVASVLYLGAKRA